ncbi:MAG: diphthamide biosynthesis enzyme Dph2 [Candidatus Bathyarchaeales archaeon]
MRFFDLEEERVKREVQRLGAKRVLVQLPEGLKPEATRLAKIIEKAGALPIISADPCYGACDLATSDAESLGVDLLIHYGHSKMLRHERVPTIYVEARATVSVEETVEKALPLLEGWRKIGLTTTVQHVQTIDHIKDVLLRAGKAVIVGDAGQLNYPGQVIGCNYSNATSIAKDVEAFLFIGGGRFHALGVALSTSKPTIAVDPYEKTASSIEKDVEKIVKQRWASIEEAKQARTMAVLVGLKPGQKQLEKAVDLKQKLEEQSKNVYLFAIREVTPEMMMEFPAIDAYVNTACPRISLDDASRFRKPILTVNEALVVIGELSWEKLCKKGWFEN